ncbi:MAG TPA: glycosyltransferase, partial [Patescibacteria group bacterium]
NTLDTVKSLKDPKIRIYKNKHNLGYPGNLEAGRQHCLGDILFLMGQDDILAPGALRKTESVFKKYPEVGALTRPYYWFDQDINIPVRAKKQLNPDKDEIVTIKSDKQKVIRVFETLDQLSGLAYRTKFFDTPFHPDIFPCHIYPFASIFKNHPVYFTKDYTIAVRIGSSQTRHISSIYDKSPMLSWVQMIENIFPQSQYPKQNNYLIKDFIARNYVGLVQLRNYSHYRYVIREIYYLIKFRPLNLLSLQFWFFSLGTLIMPPSLLIPLVDWYKNHVYARTISQIRLSNINDLKLA